LGEIRVFAGNFAPYGWALCNGALLPLSQNTALFALLGTTYGGDGRTTFGLPNLQGTAPMQQGQGAGLSERFLGESGGEPNVSLLTSEMPMHTHPVEAYDGAGNSDSPSGTVMAQAGHGRQRDRVYGSGTSPNLQLPVGTIGVTGGSLPHNNMPPYLTLTFIIALQGIFPQRP
jgi:microcystin-dependent protein